MTNKMTLTLLTAVAAAVLPVAAAPAAHLGGHTLGDRVAALGIVDGDDRDPVADFVENQFSHDA